MRTLFLAASSKYPCCHLSSPFSGLFLCSKPLPPPVFLHYTAALALGWWGAEAAFLSPAPSVRQRYGWSGCHGGARASHGLWPATAPASPLQCSAGLPPSVPVLGLPLSGRGPGTSAASGSSRACAPQATGGARAPPGGRSARARVCGAGPLRPARPGPARLSARRAGRGRGRPDGRKPAAAAMGVPKFYRWISERYPCLSQVLKEHQVSVARAASCPGTTGGSEPGGARGSGRGGWSRSPGKQQKCVRGPRSPARPGRAARFRCWSLKGLGGSLAGAGGDGGRLHGVDPGDCSLPRAAANCFSAPGCPPSSPSSRDCLLAPGPGWAPALVLSAIRPSLELLPSQAGGRALLLRAHLASLPV